jgi:two-component system cell cycle sensor histidine kinase/response regulator CckA
MNATPDDSERRDRLIPSPDETRDSTTARLVTTLQSAGDGMIVTDLQGRVEFLNLTAEHLIGLESVAAEGRPLLEVLCLEERDGRAVKGNLVDLAILSGTPIALGKDLVLKTHTSVLKQVEGEICVRNGAGSATGSVITFRDVTARNWDELQRREDQKMHAVGQLAGAIAHELNNLLTVIVGHREAIDERYSDLPPLRHSTAEIQRAADEIATVTRQLLTLSRREVLSPKATNLNTLLEQAKTKLEGLVPSNIRLTISLEPNLGTVIVDPVPMLRAILDLVGYCCDRMPAGGMIEVATANVIVDRNYRARHLRRYIELKVKDGGLTLKGVAVERLFEPIWSKDAGRPSGLGLFMVRNVVNAANGHISVESEGEVGATFVLLLPQAEEEVLVPEAAAPAATMPSHPTILLVEDDDGIRILLRNSLEKRGYRVIEARDGSEAIIQAELHEDPIHLLITDVVMPVMDGPALARDLAETRPGIRILLISGCPEELADVQQLVNRGAFFVQKPFSQRELMVRVGEILSDE